MTHITVHEWGHVPIFNGTGLVPNGHISRTHAQALVVAARDHPLGGKEGSTILVDHHSHLRAKQMVGVISAKGCSLEILPKVDPDVREETATVRSRLASMLDLALGLNIGLGSKANIARQNENLMEILIRHFADKLLVEVRRGLPRKYLPHEDDLPSLRGRLDVVRQFTTLVVHPDKLASRFDDLSQDIPLLQIMKAAVKFLMHHAKNPETIRRLSELRFLLSDVSEMPLRNLPWKRVHINRSNHRWQSLIDIARMFVKRDWQKTHRASKVMEGFSILFPMNDLFEAYVAALMANATRGLGLSVSSQGGRKYCLIEKNEQQDNYFQTKPDLLIKDGRRILQIIDTKWKRIDRKSSDEKQGVLQADVYQMMAYARVYRCSDLTLLYPHHSALDDRSIQRQFTLNEGSERLTIATLDITRSQNDVMKSLQKLVSTNLRESA